MVTRFGSTTGRWLSGTGASPTTWKVAAPIAAGLIGSELDHATSSTPGSARTSRSTDSKNCVSVASVGYVDPSGSTIIVNTLSAPYPRSIRSSAIIVRTRSPPPKSSTTAVGNLTDDEQPANGRTASCRPTSAGGEDRSRGATGRLPGRREAEQEPHRNCRDRAERHDTRVEHQRELSGKQIRRNHRRRSAQDRRTDRHPDDAAQRREHETLRQQLPNDPAPSGAERGTDRELARTRGRPRQQQIGDVATTHQQDEADDAEKEHRCEPQLVADHHGS